MPRTSNPLCFDVYSKLFCILTLMVAVSGCATLGMQPGANQPAATVTSLYAQPAERALIHGLRFYEEGNFDRAQNAFRTALVQGLSNRQDTASAYKYLAFIACAFNRAQECEQYFHSALQSDPQFRLTEVEVGHPVWGPVYQRVLKAQLGNAQPTQKEGVVAPASPTTNEQP